MNGLLLPDGFTARPATLGDAAELAALFNRVAEADGLPERLSVESMEHELSAYYDPVAEKTAVVLREASIVGYATAYSRRAEAAELRAYVNFYVSPEWRKHELEGPLLEWGVTTGTALLRKMPAERRFVCSWLMKKQKDTSARFAARGFTAVRHWWEMERSLAEPSASQPTDGFEIELWDDRHSEPARLVYNAAFADHWGSTPMDSESWKKHILDSPNFRPGLSLVAVAGNDVVGYLTCEEYPEDAEASGRREAWMAGLGVLRDWRKRGIATALLARCIDEMHADGVEYAMIGVDSDSPSGAQHLYASVGFSTKSTGTTWQLEVD